MHFSHHAGHAAVDERPPPEAAGAVGAAVPAAVPAAQHAEVPPAGLLNMGTLMGGAFSAAWFSAVVPATGSMIATGGASALFMLPFWLAGGVVAKQTVVDPVKATSLSIGEFAWELQQTAVGLPLKSFSGASDELDGCRVEVAAYVNGVPQHVLRLFAGTQAWSIGDGLTVVELEYIAAEVNAHLATLKK